MNTIKHGVLNDGAQVVRGRCNWHRSLNVYERTFFDIFEMGNKPDIYPYRVSR